MRITDTPIHVVERALRETTGRLADELLQPRPTSPSWNDFEWIIATAAAAMHGISALLAHRLQWHGPAAWHGFLDDQLSHGSRRAARTEALLARLDEVTRREAIAVIALKGAALMPLKLYGAGERPMSDIDLLARPEDLPALHAVLNHLGYQHQCTTTRHVVYGDCAPALPRGLGEHCENSLKIEVHFRVADALPHDLVDITTQLAPSELQPGINPYADEGALLLHLLLHAAGNARAHAMRLIQLEDIARMSRRFEQSVWRHCLATGPGGSPAWWALPPLLLAQRYTGARVPDDLLRELGNASPPWLRRAARNFTLNEVSWTNLRIAAFPGIEWSRSLLEACRYCLSRVAPRRAARDDLDSALRTLPMLGTTSWYELPHTVRILRWLLGRAPRVQAMATVMAAFEHAPQGARLGPGNFPV